MIWFVVLAVLILVLMLVIFQDSLPERPVSRKAAMQAAVELHRVRRQLDVAYIKTEQRRDTSRLHREIGRVLESDERP